MIPAGRAALAAMLLAAGCTAADSAPPPLSRSDGASLVADSLWVAGDSLYWTGGHDSAHAIWTRALEGAEATGDSVMMARILTSLGMAERQLGLYSAARSHGESALALKHRLRPPQDLFTSYNALGLLAWNEGRLADASRLFARASELAREAADAEQLAKVANNLALVRTEEGDFAGARAGFAEALAAARTAGVPRLEGNALTNAAMLDIRAGYPERAVPSLHRARERYRSVDYAPGEVSALGQLGVAFEATGGFPDAYAALDSALALARSHGLRQEEASNLEALAGVHHAAGDSRRALALYREGASIDRELGLVVELGSNLRQTALIYAEVGERAAAVSQVKAALEVHRTSGARIAELRDLLLLAELERDGDQLAAAGHLDTAAAIAGELGVRAARVEVALARSRYELAADRPRRALEILQGVDADLAIGGYDAEWEASDLRAAAWLALGRIDSAAMAGRRAIATVERARSAVGSGELRTAFLARRSGAYLRLVDILIRLGRIDEALVTADAMRGRVLLEHLLARRAGVVAPVAADRRILLGKLSVLAARADSLDAEPMNPADSGAIGVRRAARAELVKARRDFETGLARKSGIEAASDAADSELDPPALRKVLYPGEALLEYLIRPTRVDLFIVTRDAVRHVESGVSEQSLRTRVRLARELVADPKVTRERAHAVLSGLHDLLVAPAERAGHLRGISRLTIVPQGGLAYLPFSALVSSSSGRFLVQDYDISTGGSAALIAERRAGTRPESRSAAIAVAPFPIELPGSRAEVRAIRRLRAGTAGWEGSAATELRVRRGFASAGIVHLATHGTMNPVNPLFSRIELAPAAAHTPEDDGRLEVHEILELDLPGSLVFLSGCETGLGAAWSSPFRQGEDYVTLLQSFLQAGAGAVVGTLWRVRDDGAAALAEAFYERLPGTSSAKALAGAQRALLESSQWASPYHWAGYAVSGE